MAETLGGLVDKLSITNIKLWFVQDALHQAATQGVGLDAENTRRMKVLNLQRNQLMTEIDKALADAVRSGEAPVDPRVKLT